jgi:hypothetical protein
MMGGELCRQLIDISTWLFARYLEKQSVGATCSRLVALYRLNYSETAIISLPLILRTQIARDEDDA